MEEKNIDAVQEQDIDSSANQNDKKKKFLNIVYRVLAVIGIVAAFVLFVYLLFYSFNNDGADWLRKIA